MDINKRRNPSVEVFVTPPEFGESKRHFCLEAAHFCCDAASLEKDPQDVPNSDNSAYLIVGFDTEFKTPDYAVTREQIADGHAKYQVLSYQFHAKTSGGKEWTGICCPDFEQRLTVAEFLTFALGIGVQDHGISQLPTKIFLVGHFTRADIPSFADFHDQISFISSLRNTFATTSETIPIHFEFEDGETVKIDLGIRDTMLLTPQASKSLKALGELVEQPKITLDPDPAKHKYLISNMDIVRRENWELFKRYALNDATICVRYIELMIALYEQVTGRKKVPITLTAIGVDLLVKSWSEKHLNRLDVVGREIVKERQYNNQKGYYTTYKREVPIDQFSWDLDFFTETYHGGRNEQFWFGPGFEDDWIDLDLASAYPTAMSMIGLPDWRKIRQTSKLTDFTPTTLGFACVDFEFPEGTRYPTLPVRTENGLIFPLTGRSSCAAPEIHVARKLGCKMNLIRGVIVPSDPDQLIFGDFIKDCINKRIQAGSKTMTGLFWKEISNSTYGKTAQGLRTKRVYDMRERGTKPLPESLITNPCYASFITSFVRALLGEIMNSLPSDKMVFSCTTDGFITNAPDSVIEQLNQGDLAKIYLAAREHLTGDPGMLEVKHRILQPLGWRTRGQATLKRHPDLEDDDDVGIVLAKGGIFTKPESESDSEQNEEILSMFFQRTPDTILHVESMTGIRDIVERDADLVTKEIHKRLNMEFDWKRQSTSIEFSHEHKHIYFDTKPWRSVAQFKETRQAWDEFTRNDPACLKSLEDFHRFADFVDSRACREKSTYLRKDQPDLKRLRLMLCSAWHSGAAGIEQKRSGMSAAQFAELLVSHGVPCKKTDVENGKKKPYEPYSTPNTEKVRNCLESLRAAFPRLDIDEFLYKDTSENAVTLR